MVPTIKLPVPQYCDNTRVIKEFITDKEVKILKVASADNTSDPFTKAMSQAQLDRHLEKMGIRYISNWL